jgi:tRNA modification GTPase
VIARRAAELAGYGHLGVRLNRPFDVVLAGPPNVGKSSLINAMVGFDRSITMDVAGTTRDVLDAETVFDGWPLRLRDTAGLHESQEQIEREGISRALAAIAAADLVVLVAEPGLSHATPQLEAALEQLNRPLPVIPVLNKSDLPPAGGEDSFASGPALQQRTEDEGDEALLETVATSGRGVANLLERIVTRLVGRLPPAGAPVPINQRQWDHVRRIAALGDQPRAMLDELQAL